MDIEQDNIGFERTDDVDRSFDIVGFAYNVDVIANLGFPPARTSA